MDYKPSFALVYKVIRCVKDVRIRSFSGLYFPAFGLNTERYGVSLRIQSKCRKIRTRKNSIFGLLFEFLREVSLTRFDY